jgi:hypothetical protein
MGSLFVPLLTSILPTILGSFLAPEAPQPQQAPAAPQPAPAPIAPQVAPEAPAPVKSEVPEISRQEPVIDQEASRVRAVKRRTAAKDRQLFALSQEDDSATILTKSLLGD